MSHDKDTLGFDSTVDRREILRRGLAVAGGVVAGGAILERTAGAAVRSSGLALNGVATAQKLVAQYEKPPSSFTPPGPSFSAKGLHGKTVYVISALSIPFSQINVQGATEAFSAAGMTLKAIDGKNLVTNTTQGIEEALAQKADAILVVALQGELFTNQIAKAKAQGIPVIMVENQDPGKMVKEPPGVAGGVNQCHRCAGQLMADYTIADSGGKGKAAVLWSADIPGIGDPQVDGIKSEFARLAPGMDLEIKNVPSSQWSTIIPSLTSTLAIDQSLKYLLPVYDGMVSFMLPSIRAANAQNRVKIVTFNASPAFLQDLKSHNVVAADVGANPEQFGWAFADQTLRVLTGHPAVLDEKMPIRLFDSKNIGSLNLSAPQQTWYGNVDFKSAYKKLWGLS